ncbi:hypothetical protein KC207_16260 [Phycicoccus sp. BSK3Z-2]|uniref:Uncharacterized protein n=1 Tax=Phycicoccus avicenniae TaxID=2828860 RepID=A0A941DAS7_9MICO|nr:hypothetical protein [Phycicoccus avicenniae]MBR7744850.1 hypothetical protein [Phycicoccus avicenniae]
MQSPSSLIFLVLLAVWAAYFVQYWIRRRDHLATARSVEQFSAAMRVLERRTPIPRTDLSDPAPRSWSVHPARSARPQVAVRRASTAEPAHRPEPVAARPAMAGPEVAGPGAARPEVAPPGRSRPVRRPSTPPVPAAPRPRARVRGFVLLVSLLTTATLGVLAGLGSVVTWAPVAALGVASLNLWWARSAVRAEQAARAARRRRAQAQARRRTTASAASARRPAAPASRPAVQTPSVPPAATPTAEAPVAEGSSAGAPAGDAPAADHAVDDAPTVATAPADPVAPTGAGTPEEADGGGPEPEESVEYVHLVDEDDIPLTWDPVPVPRPTYTMKAKAERAAVTPAAVTPDPAPVERPAREEDLDERRAAGA